MKLKNFLKTLGPGILFASTAIGVSHLVQSTRAGAKFGFGLVGLVLITNLIKYPFFEYGSRYANATGTSLIDGYRRIGKWMLYVYMLITALSMFFVTAAVGFVTAGFLDNLFGLSTRFGLSSNQIILILFAACTLVLLIGKYKVLDKMIKIIGIALLFSTLIAFVLTLINGPVEPHTGFIEPVLWEMDNLPFIIALMGWMPTAVDLSTWNSIWTVERIKETDYKPSLKETLADFNFGYIVSAILSLCFITLGAYLMFGSGKTLPDAAHLFAGTVVEMYTSAMGSWSFYLIAIASFSIMFGTAIAVFDGYARSMSKCFSLITEKKENNRNYSITLITLIIISYFIVNQFTHKLKDLVDLAMIISFIIAPIIAIVNFKLVGKKYVGKEHEPKTWLKILSYIGIAVLSGFTLFFIFYRILM